MLTPRLLILVGVSYLLGLTAAQSMADAPKCGVTCFMQAMSQPEYANKTQAQLCVDESFTDLVGGCAKEACSVVEGLNIWVLNENQIASFLRYLLVVQTHYLFVLAIIKASILYFFLRIFPDKKFRNIVWATLAYDLLIGLIFIVLSFVQRQPTWLIWEGWRDKDPQGVVVDLNKMGLAHGGMNIALDVWMLVLPLTQLYKLNLKPRKKLGIMAMFCVGIFLTVVSIIRVHSLIYFATSSNATADARGTIIWSCIELCTGVVVSCMPNARQLLREGTRQIRDVTTNLTGRSTGAGSQNSTSRRRIQGQSHEMGVPINSPDATTTTPSKSGRSSPTITQTDHASSFKSAETQNL